MALGTAIPAMDNGTRTCITTETMGIHMVTGAGVVEIKGLWGRGFRKQKTKTKQNKPKTWTETWEVSVYLTRLGGILCNMYQGAIWVGSVVLHTSFLAFHRSFYINDR